MSSKVSWSNITVTGCSLETNLRLGGPSVCGFFVALFSSLILILLDFLDDDSGVGFSIPHPLEHPIAPSSEIEGVRVVLGCLDGPVSRQVEDVEPDWVLHAPAVLGDASGQGPDVLGSPVDAETPGEIAPTGLPVVHLHVGEDDDPIHVDVLIEQELGDLPSLGRASIVGLVDGPHKNAYQISSTR